MSTGSGDFRPASTFRSCRSRFPCCLTIRQELLCPTQDLRTSANQGKRAPFLVHRPRAKETRRPWTRKVVRVPRGHPLVGPGQRPGRRRPFVGALPLRPHQRRLGWCRQHPVRPDHEQLREQSTMADVGHTTTAPSCARSSAPSADDGPGAFGAPNLSRRGRGYQIRAGASRTGTAGRFFFGEGCAMSRPLSLTLHRALARRGFLDRVTVAVRDIGRPLGGLRPWPPTRAPPWTRQGVTPWNP
jgi:hypothetical protein